MADDELHAVGGKLVGDRNALLGIADVVAEVEGKIFWPRMPPAALMSSTACSAPFLSCAPKAALEPVSGPPTPNLDLRLAAGRDSESEAERQPERGQLFIA